jgi:DNA-binding NtrC family response regulator
VLPALRERRSDVAFLARRFLEEASVELRRPVRDISVDGIELLERHGWPGNVRELRNVVRQAVVHCEGLILGKELLRAVLGKTRNPTLTTPTTSAGGSLREIAEAAAAAAEKQAITETLRLTQGNKARASRLLQTDYKTLHLKMKRLGLRARDHQP